jgi:hypothetical protein
MRGDNKCFIAPLELQCHMFGCTKTPMFIVQIVSKSGGLNQLVAEIHYFLSFR